MRDRDRDLCAAYRGSCLRLGEREHLATVIEDHPYPLRHRHSIFFIKPLLQELPPSSIMASFEHMATPPTPTLMGISNHLKQGINVVGNLQRAD